MVSGELAKSKHHSFATNRTIPKITGLSRGRTVREAAFDLQVGDVLGIAGLVGSGRTKLTRLIAGVDRADQGRVETGRKR